MFGGAKDEQSRWIPHVASGFASDFNPPRFKNSGGSSNGFHCNGYNSYGFVKRIPTKVPQRIFSSDLPLNKEVTVEIVEAPLNFTDEKDDLSFFVRIKNFDDSRYYKMQEELNRYVTTRPPDVANPKEGECVIVARDGVGYRGRVVGSGDECHVYLLDYGISRTVDRMWLIDDSREHQTHFFHLSGVTVQCQLAGVKYKDDISKAKVEQILQILRERPATALRLTQVGCNGKAKLVKMMVQYDINKPEVDDFGEVIANRNLGTFTPWKKPKHNYTKAEIDSLRYTDAVEKTVLDIDLHQLEIHKSCAQSCPPKNNRQKKEEQITNI